MDLREQLKKFTPFNEQEERDREKILQALETRPRVFYRADALCHMTASAWVISPDGKRVLMAYHNIYNSWSWLGGHADGERDLLAVALREVREESGIRRVTPVTRDIFSLEILTVDGHEKHGAYVSSHLHLNVTYLLRADDKEPTTACPGENSAVAWFQRDKAVEASSEPWFRERIYQKLNARLERDYPACLSDILQV